MSPKFQYQKRDEREMFDRGDRKSGLFDSMFKDGLATTSFDAGDYTVRIMPPTWQGAKHYGLTLWQHFDVGPDRQRYLCNEKMGRTERCPVCDEARSLGRSAGSDERAKKLRPAERVLMWVVDRARESKGPLLWVISWGAEKDIAKLCRNRRTGAVIWIDDPEAGYDLDLSVERQKTFLVPGNFQVARDPSPLCEDQRTQDDWLEYITAHPLSDALVFYPAQHIAKVFGGVPPADVEGEPDAEVERSSTRHFSRETEAADERRDRRELRDKIDERPAPREAAARPSSREAEEDRPVADRGREAEPAPRARERRREPEPEARPREREDERPPAREREEARPRERSREPEPDRREAPAAEGRSRRVRATESAEPARDDRRARDPEPAGERFRERVADGLGKRGKDEED